MILFISIWWLERLKISKLYCNFISQPSGDKSDDTFHVSLVTFGTFSGNDLGNKKDFQWTASVGSEFSLLLLWLLLKIHLTCFNTGSTEVLQMEPHQVAFIQACQVLLGGSEKSTCEDNVNECYNTVGWYCYIIDCCNYNYPFLQHLNAE